MDESHRTRIAEAIRSLGASEVARRLGLSTETVLRLAGGFGAHPGTELLAVTRIEALADRPNGAPDAA